MPEQIAPLYVTQWGTQGRPTILLHGSLTPDPALVWGGQQPLADQHRLLVADRRGYWRSPGPAADSRPAQSADVGALLGDGAHLVGFSYGAVVALLAAAAYADRIYSLTLVEPPAFHLAAGLPAADALCAAIHTLWTAAPTLTPPQFVLGFARLFDPAAVETSEEWSPQRLRSVQATMREPPPTTAPLDLAGLAATPFPKLVVTGGWHAAFEAVGDVLAARLPAQRLVIAGGGHGAHHRQEPFNAQLRALWQQAEAGRSTAGY